MGTIDVGGVEASSALDVGPGVLSRLEGLTFSLISLKPIEKPTSWISD